jgi:DNA-binding NtrC family response regulator
MIVVVDDEPFINELICELLTDAGYIAFGYGSADDAYAAIAKEYPDLVVLDLRLGEVEAGLSLLKKMRMHRLTNDIPAIMCSCATDRLNALQAELHSLHCATLEKPFNISDLVTVAQRALAGSFASTYVYDRSPIAPLPALL